MDISGLGLLFLAGSVGFLWRLLVTRAGYLLDIVDHNDEVMCGVNENHRMAIEKLQRERAALQAKVETYSGHTHDFEHQHAYRRLSTHEVAGKIQHVLECKDCMNRMVLEL